MNTSSTITTAFLRGLYSFFGSGLVAGITAYLGFSHLVPNAITDAPHPLVSDRDIVVYSVLTGVLAGLGALGWRGGVEGLYDAGRQSGGQVKPGDVQPGQSGNP